MINGNTADSKSDNAGSNPVTRARLKIKMIKVKYNYHRFSCNQQLNQNGKKSNIIKNNNKFKNL